MVAIKLKGVDVVNFEDKTVGHDIFEGTFAPETGSKKTMHEFAFEFSNGQRIQLNSPKYGEYGEPDGFASVQELIPALLENVTNGNFARMTTSEFIAFIVGFASGDLLVKNTIGNKTKEALIIPLGSFNAYQTLAYNGYIEDLITWYDFKDKLALDYSVVTADLTVMTLEDFI